MIWYDENYNQSVKKSYEKVLDNEAAKIVEELLYMYDNQVKTDKTFQGLVEEKIQSRGLPHNTSILTRVIHLIPLGLSISNVPGEIFITEEELQKRCVQKRQQIDKSSLEKEAEKVVKKIIADEESGRQFCTNIVQVINEYVVKNDYKVNAYTYLVECVLDKIVSSGYDFASMNPLVLIRSK